MTGFIQAATTTINALVPEKVEQAIKILNEVNVDVWVTFAEKKGFGQGDPVLELIFGERDLGGGILILTRDGQRIANYWLTGRVAGRDHDDGDIAQRGISTLDLQEPKTVHFWHDQIEKHGVRPLLAQ